MSETMDDMVVAYPKTVTACHSEIKRLEKLLATTTRNLDQRDEELDEAKRRVDELEEDGKSANEATEVAIHQFLDELEWTGPMRFDVPQTPRVNSAIVALHDCVGRRP